MISIQGLEKRYGDVRAVSGVSFEVQRGEIVGLLGHNGAGKTTIMKIMTGFLEPTAGRVSVGGIDVGADRIGVQRQIGYLPENAPLYPEMLVQEYLLMMAELRGVPASARKAAVIDAVKATGLEGFLVRPISTLSKGYRQRVGLAQALLHKPDVLVLDEPTNGLDPVQIVEIRELIRRLAKDTTIILSTHILSEIEAVCDRVVILIKGELATDARLDELLASHRVRLRLKGGKDIIKALAGVEGVERVKRDGEVGGYTRYLLDCAESAAPIPALLKLADAQGWAVGEAAIEQPNLETLFRELMDARAHQARKAKEGAA
ncbi:ABC transporter ATP-binding protein [Myxococcota bacterium]|nr:ABC transporter ATP-binding protein [Myxococcota bacterium]MBU1431899.1 ABC transporter ATP-binding protein [Myxococcota bacterium]MBU1900478.1 ABC transporter ATP-binding protein [Myxococcota bacterium]